MPYDACDAFEPQEQWFSSLWSNMAHLGIDPKEGGVVAEAMLGLRHHACPLKYPLLAAWGPQRGHAPAAIGLQIGSTLILPAAIRLQDWAREYQAVGLSVLAILAATRG